MSPALLRISVLVLGILSLAACTMPAVAPDGASPTEQPAPGALRFVEFYSPM
jgi:hypothetical protein